jgi:hypothetical protein
MAFYKQVLEFHCPSKLLCQTSGRQNHWSLLLTQMSPLAGKPFQAIATMTYTRWHTLPSQKDLGCMGAPSFLHGFICLRPPPLVWPHGWRKLGIIHWGGGGYLRCPVFTSVHFSLRNEGSSVYIHVCEGRESLSPNFKTFDPRHQFRYFFLKKIITLKLIVLSL